MDTNANFDGNIDSNVNAVARQLLDRLGAQALEILKDRAAVHRRQGDEHSALYWQRVAKAARILLFFDGKTVLPDWRPIELPLDFFKSVFYRTPRAGLLLRPDLKIVGANPAYLAATMTRESEIIGCDIFDVFPDNPDDGQVTGTANLGASFRRVLDSSLADRMALQRYDVRNRDGVFEERWWKPVNAPVFDQDGRLSYILHQAEDVTGRVGDAAALN